MPPCALEHILRTPHLRQLPYDVVCVVFRHLPVEALVVCGQTCSVWRQAALAERKRRTLGLADTALAWVEANPGELVLAGSMALWLSEGAPTRWFPGDADVFYHSGLAQDTPAGDLEERHISCGQHAFGFLCRGSRDTYDNHHPQPRVEHHATPNGTIQFILSSEFQNATHVLESFDLSCCMVGYTARGQCLLGSRYASPAFTIFRWFRHAARLNTYSDCPLASALISNQTARTHARAQKYKARGYTHSKTSGATLHQMRFAMVYERRKKFAVDSTHSFESVFDHANVNRENYSDVIDSWRGHLM